MNPIRAFQIAVIASAVALLALLALLQSQFLYLTPSLARMIGIPMLFALIFISFWIVGWQGAKAKIYGALFVLFLLSFVPLALFCGNTIYPSQYYMSSGEIVIQRFPGNVWEGKITKPVNDDVIVAYEWQHGKKTDASGNLIRFYRKKQDGSIAVYNYPVEKDEVMSRLDSVTSETYLQQEVIRAHKFLDEGDRNKAKEIVSYLRSIDLTDDDVYRLGQQISRQEQDENAIAESNRQKLESEAELSTNSKPIEQESAERIPSEQDVTINKENVSPEIIRTPKTFSKRRSSTYSPVSYPYSSESVYQPITVVRQPIYSSPAPTPSYIAPRIPPAQQPTATLAARNATSSTAGSIKTTLPSTPKEEKKGMSRTKKVGIALGVIGGGIFAEELLRRRKH